MASHNSFTPILLKPVASVLTLGTNSVWFLFFVFFATQTKLPTGILMFQNCDVFHLLRDLSIRCRVLQWHWILDVLWNQRGKCVKSRWECKLDSGLLASVWRCGSFQWAKCNSRVNRRPCGLSWSQHSPNKVCKASYTASARNSRQSWTFCLSLCHWFSSACARNLTLA